MLTSDDRAGRAGVAPSAALEEPLQRTSATGGPKDGAAAQEGAGGGSGPQGASSDARADLAAMLWNYALHRKRTAD